MRKEIKIFKKNILEKYNFEKWESTIFSLVMKNMEVVYQSLDILEDEGVCTKSKIGMSKKHPANETLRIAFTSVLAGLRALGISGKPQIESYPGKPGPKPKNRD